jgi:hypothetical protein
LLAGRAGRTQLSTAGANLAELGRDPPAYGTVIEYMVHTFNDREEWLMCSFHRALPPIIRAPRSGGEEGESNRRADSPLHRVSSILDTLPANVPGASFLLTRLVLTGITFGGRWWPNRGAHANE